VSGWLLDVNVLLGCAWRTHADHAALLAWLLRTNDWATCPIVESGFMRISMTQAYDASFGDAQQSLTTLRALNGHHFVTDDINAGSLPILTNYKETTDAHLVMLAKRHGRRLATLDITLIEKPWAIGIAENPLLLRPRS
jgi:uncharacterized protein